MPKNGKNSLGQKIFAGTIIAGTLLFPSIAKANDAGVFVHSTKLRQSQLIPEPVGSESPKTIIANLGSDVWGVISEIRKTTEGIPGPTEPVSISGMPELDLEGEIPGIKGKALEVAKNGLFVYAAITPIGFVCGVGGSIVGAFVNDFAVGISKGDFPERLAKRPFYLLKGMVGTPVKIVKTVFSFAGKSGKRIFWSLPKSFFDGRQKSHDEYGQKPSEPSRNEWHPVYEQTRLAAFRSATLDPMNGK